MFKTHKKAKIASIVVGVLLVVALAVCGFAGNFLFEFALDPTAETSMASLMASDDDEAEEVVLDEDYAEEAAAWFEESRQSVSHVAEDGTELYGWRIDQPEDSHLYFVACHGYVGEPADMAKYAYHFYERGYNVLTPAARAHERNVDTGYIQMGWQDSKDLVGWVEDLVAEDPEAQIVLFGVSMGGAEVMMASGWDLPENVRCIIEDCGYTSVWDEFALQLDDVFGLPTFPLLNAADLVTELRAGYGFAEASAVDQLQNATVPMLFIHGDADDFVPFSMLDEVYDACASEDKEKLVVEGAGHADSASTDPELYWSTVDDFVARHVG